MSDWAQDMRDARNAQTKCEEAGTEMDRELGNLEGHLEQQDTRIEELESEVELLKEQLDEALKDRL